MSGSLTYVQVRYRHGERWVTVTASEDRVTARSAAANAYHDLRDPHGESPTQVRLVSAAQLTRETGERGVRIADAAVARHADPHTPP